MEFGSKARRRTAGALAWAMVLCAVSGPAAFAADAQNGKKIALQWCSSCHLVSEDQDTAASVSLPSFFDLSKDESWTEDNLKTFLADPHPKMPNMNLANREIADIARYIDTLTP